MRKQIGLRLPEDVCEALAKAAEADGRTVNSLITAIIKNWLKGKP